jgi:hypothetical protein
MLARRGFLAGLIATLAAPAIIRPGLLMPVRRILIPVDCDLKAFDGLLTFADFDERYLRPAAQQLASDIDAEIVNGLRTPSMITNETLRLLERNLIVADWLNPAFEPQFRGIGSTLRIRVPNRFTVSA